MHPPAELALVGGEAGVASGLQQVRAHGDGDEPESDGVGEVVAVDAGGEGEGKAVGEGAAKAPYQVHRQHVERGPREIDLGDLLGDEAAMGGEDERVGELGAEAEAQRASLLAQAVHHRHRLLPLGVLDEGAVGDLEVAVAEDVVEELAGARRAEQGGVELDDAGELQLLHQELDHALDLRRRAAVESGEGDAAREARREVEVTQRTELWRQLPPQPLDDLRGVPHAAQERLHAIVADPGQVVAHARVEDQGAEGGLFRDAGRSPAAAR